MTTLYILCTYRISIFSCTIYIFIYLYIYTYIQPHWNLHKQNHAWGSYLYTTALHMQWVSLLLQLSLLCWQYTDIIQQYYSTVFMCLKGISCFWKGMICPLKGLSCSWFPNWKFLYESLHLCHVLEGFHHPLVAEVIWECFCPLSAWKGMCVHYLHNVSQSNLTG